MTTSGTNSSTTNVALIVLIKNSESFSVKVGGETKQKGKGDFFGSNLLKKQTSKDTITL